MFCRSDDPAADFSRWDRLQNRKLAQRPICADCEEHIQDDHYFEINGEPICPNCMDAYRREIEDY